MPWLALRTKPNHEQIAAANAAWQGHATYLPRFFDLVRKCRRPLFPSYVFVSDIGTFFHLRSTRGALGPVMIDGHPAVIRDQVIDEIRMRENEHGNVVLENPIGLTRGDKVRIRHGSFCGKTAIYDGQADRERVRVLLHLLGSERSITLPVGAVEAA